MSIKAKQRTLVVGSAAAICAIGVLATPAPSWALPMVPLGPAGCEEYGFNGKFVLNQSNGFRVEFVANGSKAQPAVATAFGNNGQVTGTGPVEGKTLPNNRIDFLIDWNGPSAGRYRGDIDSHGLVSGTTQDEGQPGAPGSTATWQSATPLTCVRFFTDIGDPVLAPDPGPKPRPEPPPPVVAPQKPAAPTATVTSDVDVYNKPGGAGDVIGILRKGAVVTVVKACPADDWCALGDGRFAFGEFFRNN